MKISKKNICNIIFVLIIIIYHFSSFAMEQHTLQKDTAKRELKEHKIYDSIDMQKINQLTDSLLKDDSLIQHDYSANQREDPMVYFGMFYREIKQEIINEIESKQNTIS